LLVQRKKPKKARPGTADARLRFSPHRALRNSSAAKYVARLKQVLA